MIPSHQDSNNQAATTVQIMRVGGDTRFALPAYATAGSAGLDLVAAIHSAISLAPSQTILIPTGIAIALPQGFEAQIRPRSGLAVKHGITVLNAPGTIDSDYRGEIKVALINLSQESFMLDPGIRIAQMVIARYTRIDWLESTNLEETVRGSGGFGSTGLK